MTISEKELTQWQEAALPFSNSFFPGCVLALIAEVRQLQEENRAITESIIETAAMLQRITEAETELVKNRRIPLPSEDGRE